MGEMTMGVDGDRRERVERALSLLVQASRTSPPLRSAVAIVEEEIRLAWAAKDEPDWEPMYSWDTPSPPPGQ